MKKLLIAAAFVLTSAGIAAADPVEGLWKTEPGETGGYLHVQIAQCDDKICGTIAAGVDKDGKSNANYEHKGKRMLWGMRVNGNGKYSKGKIWAPDADKTYGSKMALNGDKLVVKGCVAGGLICRSQNWVRLK